jgi:hypothetical protein
LNFIREKQEINLNFLLKNKWEKVAPQFIEFTIKNLKPLPNQKSETMIKVIDLADSMRTF